VVEDLGSRKLKAKQWSMEHAGLPNTNRSEWPWATTLAILGYVLCEWVERRALWSI
jgi:hypothetical protein